MKQWKIQLTINVADSWVSDGFNAKERLEQIEELMAELLPYAYGNEFVVKAKIIKEPAETEILKLQGH